MLYPELRRMNMNCSRHHGTVWPACWAEEKSASDGSLSEEGCECLLAAFYVVSELRRMCGNYSWHHFMVYQFAEQRRKVSAGERLPADRCECLLGTFYVVSRIEEDGWGLLVCQGLSQQFDWIVTGNIFCYIQGWGGWMWIGFDTIIDWWSEGFLWLRDETLHVGR